LKKTLLSLLLMTLSLFAQPDWIHSYEEAKEQAAKADKPIMIMLSREGCDACWYMEHIVFKDANLLALLKQFVPVYLDVNKDTLPEQFQYVGTPTFHFSDASGERIAKAHTGAANVKDFSTILKGVIENKKQQVLKR